MTNRMIASRLTAVGRGAVATIRVVGDFLDASNEPVIAALNSLYRAANGKPLCEQSPTRISFGEWGDESPEELVVCRVDEKALEIHCHGGEAAVQRILTELSTAGCEIVDWRTSRIISSDLLDAECQTVLSQTSTWKTTRIVLRQSQGLLKTAFEKLLNTDLQDPETFRESVDQLLKWSRFGLHLSAPWNVVLTGRPNVGKSSLMNALLGYQRAIVFNEPGTTRDVVTGETALEGWPVMLADTAGIRDQASPLELAGIALARNQLDQADLRMVLIDVSQPMTDEDAQLIQQWPDAVVVAHKYDLPHGDLPDGAICVSSVTGVGLADLQQLIVTRLVPEVPDQDTPIVLTQRQIDCLTSARDAETVEDRLQALKQLIEPDEI